MDIIDEKYTQIIDYWKSFFPEVREEEQIEKIIYCIYGKNLKELAQLREEENIGTEQTIRNTYFRDNAKSEKLSIMNAEIQKTVQWVYFFEPIMQKYFAAYCDLVYTTEVITEKEQFLFRTLENLYRKMVNMSFRTIVMEIGIADEEGKLSGSNSEEKGLYFCQHLLRNEEYLIELYGVYPELIRLLDCAISDTYEYLKEIILQTEEKQNDKSFPYKGLLNIDPGQGDTHNKGKSVAKLVFNNGVVYYKPRNMSIELNFMKFQNWLKDEIADYKGFFTYEIWGNEKSGFMKEIENEECGTLDEVREFYYKIGQLLCVLYTFNAKDFHCENIIARGSTPVFIDMETLLHITKNDNTEDNIVFCVSKAIEESVIGTLLLPSLLPNMNTDEAMEIGGIGKAIKQYSPFKTQIINNLHSSDISIEYVNKEILIGKNYPVFNGKPIGCSGYLSDIRNGFYSIYKWILANKEKYTAGIKSTFAGTESRVIVKNTNMYTQLIDTGYHPDLLHNKWDRNIYLCRIGMILLQRKDWDNAEVYRYEHEEMRNGDVPIFYVEADKNVMRSRTGQRFSEIENEETVFEMIERKINEMGEYDCQRQLSLINESFMGSNIITDLPKGTGLLLEHAGKNDKAGVMKTESAKRIADLCNKRGIKACINGRNEMMWIGMIGFGNDYYRISPVGYSLYKGNSGIALFYYMMYRKTLEQKYREIADKAFEPVLEHICGEDKTENVEGWGAFSGIVSEIYTALYIYRHKLSDKIDDACMKKILRKNLPDLRQVIKGDIKSELLTGLAGFLGVFITAYECNVPEMKEEIYSFIIELGDAIVSRAVKAGGQAVTWTENDIGYAHGNAGVIAQLSRLYRITKNKKTEEIINAALLLERTQYFDKTGNKWIFRKNTHYFSWCNGIGGLITEKIMLLQANWDDPQIYTELKLLCDQLKQTGFGLDSGICHGDMGSIQLLKYVGKFLKDPDLCDQCDGMLEKFVSNYLSVQWDKLMYTEDWGLMTGFSGIGMSLIAEDEELVDILCLR